MGSKPMTEPLTIIGMGFGPDDLSRIHLKKIEQAEILIGGKRHLSHFAHLSVEKHEITRDINEIVDFIIPRLHQKRMVVLASGDPLFYGIGAFLIKRLGPQHVLILPNITTVAGAFARIKESWHDAQVVSLHGRNHEHLLEQALVQTDKVAVYTDTRRNPAWLAKWLIEKKIDDFTLCVLEQLGTPAERFAWYPPAEAAEMSFAEPNLLVLKRRSAVADRQNPVHLGTPEQAFEHQQGLITKAEIRAVTLAKLRLASDHLLWDLGAGSGSVSIEAALFVTRGRIYAVEKRPDRVAQIERNRSRFKIGNLEILCRELPEGLGDLPMPDRIFIGGGGRNLQKIIQSAAGRLKPGGIMVVNTVLIANIETALRTLKHLGFKTDLVQVQISRGREMPWDQRLEAQNPVWIITGERSCSDPSQAIDD